MNFKQTYFVASCAILTIAFVITTAVLKGEVPGIVDLGVGIVFGLLMSLIFNELQNLWNARKSSKKLFIQPQPTEQHARFLIKGEKQKVLHTLKTVLPKQKWQLIEEDPTLGELAFRTGVSWRSYGEVIRVQASQISQGEVDIDIRSMPSWRKTETDHEKHQENIEQVARILHKM